MLLVLVCEVSQFHRWIALGTMQITSGLLTSLARGIVDGRTLVQQHKLPGAYSGGRL